MSDHVFYVGGCLDYLRNLGTDSVDLVMCSPPYENARSYSIGFNLRGQEYVDWCVEIYKECVRVSRGLVAWVIEGRTVKFQWTSTPALLMADLHRAGVRLRKPPIFHRVGIPGSGGPDWWRNDYEFVVCASKGRLPWSDPCAFGHPPKWNPGGDLSHRMPNGRRVARFHTKTVQSGDKIVKGYVPPERANPGNVIHTIVGGGRMGHPLSHENEAPYPLDLASRFVVSFCPMGGTVLDPFCGSGTTMHAAEISGRKSINIDIREDQIDLCRRRLHDIRDKS